MKISVDLELEIESYLEGLRKIELAESVILVRYLIIIRVWIYI